MVVCGLEAEVERKVEGAQGRETERHGMRQVGEVGLFASGLAVVLEGMIEADGGGGDGGDPGALAAAAAAEDTLARREARHAVSPAS